MYHECIHVSVPNKFLTELILSFWIPNISFAPFSFFFWWNFKNFQRNKAATTTFSFLITFQVCYCKTSKQLVDRCLLLIFHCLSHDVSNLVNELRSSRDNYNRVSSGFNPFQRTYNLVLLVFNRWSHPIGFQGTTLFWAFWNAIKVKLGQSASNCCWTVACWHAVKVEKWISKQCLPAQTVNVHFRHLQRYCKAVLECSKVTYSWI